MAASRHSSVHFRKDHVDSKTWLNVTIRWLRRRSPRSSRRGSGRSRLLRRYSQNVGRRSRSPPVLSSFSGAALVGQHDAGSRHLPFVVATSDDRQPRRRKSGEEQPPGVSTDDRSRVLPSCGGGIVQPGGARWHRTEAASRISDSRQPPVPTSGPTSHARPRGGVCVASGRAASWWNLGGLLVVDIRRSAADAGSGQAAEGCGMWRLRRQAKR